MRKFSQVSIVILLVLALAVTALALTGASSAMAGRPSCADVGWNSRSMACITTAALPGPGALALRVPVVPLVGWNG